tara:strand:+ start:40 stop:246 length:207 start_codon:yes stop_codon:yes gene_type:complete
MEKTQLSEDGIKTPSFKEVKALVDDYVNEWRRDKARGNYKISPLFYMFVHYADDQWIEEQIEERGIIA